MSHSSKKYDLEERTAKFGEEIIIFCKSLPQNTISKSLINQLIRSATSIGANYMEANGASSKKDFRNKIHICKKEAQETQHWLRMLSVALPEHKIELKKLWQEAHELVLIFQKITTTLKN
ncbi:MAG TPA: four helix bundle protein [Candidatus Saccharimonadales bacterium]|nr:four helix bundle protein [Candidatus Saccharimonadales bacterium]